MFFLTIFITLKTDNDDYNDGTDATMSNVTTAHTNILQTMLAQFHALCLNITKHGVNSTHI